MTRPPEGTVLVNIGDMMHRWTSDKFLSTVCFDSCFIDVKKQKKKKRNSLPYVLHFDPSCRCKLFSESISISINRNFFRRGQG